MDPLAVDDLGVNDTDPVDYPDVGRALAERVAAGDYQRGILVCGTGAATPPSLIDM